MGILFREHVEEDGSRMKFRCLCGMDVATEGSLVWEGFMGSQGRNINVPAYLFRTSVNADVRGAPRQEVLSTGRYLLVDVTCRACCTLLGWQYLEAEKEDQKYKEHCFLLRQSLLDRVFVDSPESAESEETAPGVRVTGLSTSLPRQLLRRDRFSDARTGATEF